ncbi:MAG TPA: DNA recombination/repair protein RecA, partial [Thermoanaerobaculia bacterium]|nr:DNA recombination/repair protein RecA [Thermoanaerobaculia bacterium]
KSNCAVIFLNQLREKVGIMFGNPETQPGGRALKFYASIRLDIRKVEVIKNGLDSIGARVKVKVVKNKVAPPFRSAEFDILADGISREGALIDGAIEYGIIEKSGTWMSYGEMRLGQGREHVRNFLRENPTLCVEIEKSVRAKAAIKAADAMPKPRGVAGAPGTNGTAPAPAEAEDAPVEA